MERGVYDLDLVRNRLDDLRMDDLLLQLCHIRIIDLGTDHVIQALCLRVCLIHRLDAADVFDRVYLADDVLIMRRCDLRTVLPVYLVAVILGRVVGCSDHDAGLAAQFAQCKRKFRSRS